jgi:hypothetical protein
MNIFDYYDVYESGIVVRKDTGRVIKQYKNDNGYFKVQLSIGGRRRKMRVHRMVCMKYLANPMGHAYVNHKDGDKSNNHVGNLEWCSASENMNHAIRTGVYLVGYDRGVARLTREDVLEARARYANGETQMGIYESYKGKIGWWSFRDMLRNKTYKDYIADLQ